MNIGFLFPGQGSQSIGMGKDIYEEYEAARKIYNQVKNITGIDIAKISFEGPEDILNETKYTQLAILTESLAILEILKDNNITANMSAGLSLGEYTALINSKALMFEEGIKIVQKRGEYMQNLLPSGEWQMAAIIGLNDNEVEDVCKKVKLGFVVPANYNSVGQVVISGEKVAINEAEKIAKEMGAKKVRVLKTAGPFHTEKLQESSEALRKELENITIHKFETKVIKNIDGKIYKDTDDLISIGIIGLIKGIDTYSHKHGTKLATYCARCIDNEILMYFRNDKKNSKNISIDEKVGFDKDGNEITFMEILKTPKPDFAEDLHIQNNIKLLSKYINILSDREKSIIYKRYGLNNTEELTQKEIAKELGISRSYVSRIEKRALTKLLREFIKNNQYTE